MECEGLCTSHAAAFKALEKATAATDLLVTEIERLSDELADHKLLVAELLRDSLDGTCQQPDDDEDTDDDG